MVIFAVGEMTGKVNDQRRPVQASSLIKKTSTMYPLGTMVKAPGDDVCMKPWVFIRVM